MSSVTFWFGWFWKALWTMPEFLGGNWIGAIFAFACVFFYERRKVFNLETFRAAPTGREKFRVLGGFLMDHWTNTLGLWLCILGFFFGGHTLDLFYHNMDSISAKNGGNFRRRFL
jgi:hypothetical protein